MTSAMSGANNKRRRGGERDNGRTDYEWGKAEAASSEDDNAEPVHKEKADFGLSGALAKDEKTGNVKNGVVLKFAEPADAAKPTTRWRLYVFRGEALLETLHIHRQSAYLAGRDEAVCDLKLMHPSISKQHAVLQYRKKVLSEGGAVEAPKIKVTPYIMDLGSTNGTFLNGDRIEDARFYELLERDVLKFGESSREFVLLRSDADDKAK